ncbi:MAG: hypothetical protein ACREEG_16685, partial [Phenylobacterium sp.]
ALKDAGHSDEDANVYAEGVRRGGTLVSVKPASETEAETARRILDDAGVDTQRRGEDYRASGWQAYDPAAPVYSADEIAMERDRYREARSFEPVDSVAEALAPRSLGEDRELDAPRPRPADPTLRDV